MPNSSATNDFVSTLDVEIPEAGEWQEVAKGIFWIRMPLPFDLNHINLYLLEDGDAFTLIDTGIGTLATKACWESLIERYNIKLKQVIVTHMHPDHIGLAGWLTERFKVPLLMTYAEYFTARAIVAGGQGADNWQDKVYLQRAGFDEEYIEKNTQSKNGIRKVVSPIPLSYFRLQHNSEVKIGDDIWKVMVGRGHSPEHACLYCESRQILISGDHVLPQISPNIGVYNTEPEGNTLKLYLETLPQFLTLPQNTLVLPSHKQPIYGLHNRVNELLAHHHEHLENLIDFCQEPRNLVQCLPILFKRELNEHNMFFAVAECLSHLNYLMYENKLKRTLENKQYRYQAIIT
jgi:glyoxylase-like metal-dependent hydrolase (beta-lactamase superfamily II)